MNRRLKRETRKLTKSWMQYDETMLRDYLVERVEDPRLNVQSILTRHFLIEQLFGSRFAVLQHAELQFALAMNWFLKLVEQGFQSEDAKDLLYALSKGADRAGGIEIPHYVSQIFAGLPMKAEGMRIPNYIRDTLKSCLSREKPALREGDKALFQSVWKKVLARRRPERFSVLEPACGSANDYRFLEAFGLSRLIDYKGFDLCEKNVRNSNQLFPRAHFGMGNVFEIAAPRKSFDFCFVHDLFEHLSAEGLKASIAEICRVTRQAICAHFFNMAEVESHSIKPVDDYHWNLLSMAKVRELFRQHGFTTVQVIHIGTFLRWSLHCPETYNQGAYTFILSREGK